jgi:hypothetical protein
MQQRRAMAHMPAQFFKILCVTQYVMMIQFQAELIPRFETVDKRELYGRQLYETIYGLYAMGSIVF